MVGSGKYRLGQRLGGGGMAEVFRGTLIGAEGFSRPVAIKHMLPSFSADESFAEMFVNEARIASYLSHPNIVSVLDFDRDHLEQLFIVMELVEGKDLRHLLRTGPIPVPISAFIIGELLQGLAFAHSVLHEGVPLGIVHRDVSPHNLLLSWDGGVKLSDFGIAKAAEGTAVTRSGVVKGKLGYLSPEQIECATLDGRSDLFAAGIILHEMLTGQRLFAGAPDRVILSRILTQSAPLAHTINPAVPPALSAFCARLLERSRERRFSTAQSALVALVATGATSPHGQIELARLMYDRFPTEAPSAAWKALTPATGTQGGTAETVPSGSDALATKSDGERRGATAGGGPTRSDRRRGDQNPVAPAAPFADPTASYGGTPLRSQAGLRSVAPAVGAGILGSVCAGLLWVALARSSADEVPLAAPIPIAAEAPPAPATAPKGEAHITSVPPGAAVWVHGEAAARGLTPLTLQVEHAEELHLRLELEGHAPATGVARPGTTFAASLSPLPPAPEPQTRRRTSKTAAVARPSLAADAPAQTKPSEPVKRPSPLVDAPARAKPLEPVKRPSPLVDAPAPAKPSEPVKPPQRDGIGDDMLPPAF